MVYKTASQKILVWLFIITLAVTIVSGSGYWKMWSVLPTTFFMLWLAGKHSNSSSNLFFCIDTMFMDGNAYKYEPNYENWRDQNTPNY